MQIPMLALLSAVLQDLELSYAPFGAMRDLLTIINRVEHEGISFLTITLPSYHDSIILSLENGYLDPSLFRNFAKKRNKPLLFWGLVDRVFDDTGAVRDFINPLDIAQLRQICYLFKKIKIDCSPARVERALLDFVQTDKEVFNHELSEDLQTVADIVISTIFQGDYDHTTQVPKPGPGAVFENLKGNAKYRCRIIASSVKEFFGESCIHASEEWCRDDYREIQIIKYPCNRITTVPKTLKSPRIIAIEPSWTMMYQQAIKNYLCDKIDNSWLVSGQINFTNQKINQLLALSSSRHKKFATIDLSEASDRLGNIQVQNFFRADRSLLDALQATRTGESLLPQGLRIDLQKFASMGSATCFPVEALCFYIATLTGLLRAEGLPPTLKNIKTFSKLVWVYGDDIIAPSSAYSSISELFTSLGWRVNLKKSFYKGLFRESCGLDAYDGVEITPTYVRTALSPDAARTPNGYASLLSTANQLYSKQLLMASLFLAKFVERNTKPCWPVKRVQPESGGIGVFMPNFSYGQLRWNSKLHRYEQKVPVIIGLKTVDHLEGHPALFKSLTNRNLFDSDHLECTSLRYGSCIKHRWVEVDIHRLAS